MEVRLLNGNEIPAAAGTAADVYNACVLPCIRTQFEINQFRQYIDVNYLWNEMCGNRLFLWGIFEDGLLAAVSAMQNVGHITMLYVRPYYQRRGYGSLLLNTMRMFAVSALQIGRVTINVTPVLAAPFFLKRGFCQAAGMPVPETFLPLECFPVNTQAGTPYGNPGNIIYAQSPLKPEKKMLKVVYTTKKIRTKTVLLLVFVVFALLFLIGISYTLYNFDLFLL